MEFWIANGRRSLHTIVNHNQSKQSNIVRSQKIDDNDIMIADSYYIIITQPLLLLVLGDIFSEKDATTEPSKFEQSIIYKI